MARESRWRSIALSLLAVGICGVVAWNLRPQSLLEKATRQNVNFAKNGFSALSVMTYRWISPTEFVYVKPQYLSGPNAFPIRSMPQCSLVRVNARTGAEDPLTALNKQMSGNILIQLCASPSPDGQRVAWRNSSSNQMHITHLDGTHDATWPLPIEYAAYLARPYWTTDSRHVIGISVKPSYPNATTWIVTLDALHPDVVDRMPIASFDPGGSPLLFTGFDLDSGLSRTELLDVNVDSGGAFCTISSLPLLPHAALAHWRILAPKGLYFAQPYKFFPGKAGIAFSPQRNYLAWLFFSKPHVPASLALLHRLFPKFAAPPRQRVSLWVSALDGTGMREVAAMEMAPPKPNTPGALAQGPFGLLPGPGFLRWLPDGKQVSFVYKNALWTVPVD